jgi:O-acetyl-ADP-ribose deacetylase (regulator of RNase III)
MGMTIVDGQLRAAFVALREAMQQCRDQGVGDEALGQAAMTEAMPLLVLVYGPERASAMLRGLSDLAAIELERH